MKRFRWNRRARNGRTGNTFVEASLVFTLFLTIFIGTVEMGRAIWCYNTLSYAVRQAGRYAAVRGDLGDPNTPTNANGDHPIDAVIKQNAVGLDPNLLTIQKNWTPDFDRGSTVSIEVTYPVELIAYKLFVQQGSFTLGAKSQMTIMN